MSPAIQRLIENGLFDRLPVTFSAFFYDQIQGWQLLFPAERTYFERLFGLLDRSDRDDVAKLFAPLREIELKMGVNAKTWPPGQFTLAQVDFLNRSPHYPEWRRAVAAIFGPLDEELNQQTARKGHPRLSVVLLPAELPVGPDRMWLRIRNRGRMIPLKLDKEEILAEARKFAVSLDAAKRGPYTAWVVESGADLVSQAHPSAVRLSYEGLERYRMRLMKDVQAVVEKEQVRGPRELGTRLKAMKILESEGEYGKDPLLAEFIRAILLTGNGTLLLNNTFVEWAAVQAVRRARPDVMLVSFGIRNKVKPFSSLLIYSDQKAATPIPTQADTLGSYVDLEVMCQYVWQEFEKYPEYRRNTAHLFLADGMEEMLVIAPPDFPLLAASGARTPSEVFRAAGEWMNS